MGNGQWAMRDKGVLFKLEVGGVTPDLSAELISAYPTI